MEEQMSLLDKYFQLYEDKHYKEKIYEFSYASMIDHFIEYKIYKYDEGNLPDQDMINKEFEKTIFEIKDFKLKSKLIIQYFDHTSQIYPWGLSTDEKTPQIIKNN